MSIRQGARHAAAEPALADPLRVIGVDPVLVLQRVDLPGLKAVVSDAWVRAAWSRTRTFGRIRRIGLELLAELKEPTQVTVSIPCHGLSGYTATANLLALRSQAVESIQVPA